MSHRKFTLCSSWGLYSKKLCSKIENPHHGGFFTEEAAGLRLVISNQGDSEDGNAVSLYLLIDLTDGVIVDAKFQAFGSPALIGATEAACEMLIRKNYDQASRLTADLIDRHVRDKMDSPAFPEETFCYLNLVLDAILCAAEQCRDIPLAESYTSSPIEPLNEKGDGYPGWNLLSREQKITVIEEVIASDIRPYIELDAGGVQILDLVDDRDLMIAYEGACTSCHSATGATLNAIQEILRAKVDSNLRVVPDASFLSLPRE